MRIVLQRVARASVTIDGTVRGRIARGFCILAGFTHGDTARDVEWMADEVDGAVLVISQFTLYGDAGKGRRPSFVGAAPPPVAIPLYEGFIAALRDRGVPVFTGEFGAHMEVEMVNDGPVTLVLERGPE